MEFWISFRATINSSEEPGLVVDVPSKKEARIIGEALASGKGKPRHLDMLHTSAAESSDCGFEFELRHIREYTEGL